MSYIFNTKYQKVTRQKTLFSRLPIVRQSSQHQIHENWEKQPSLKAVLMEVVKLQIH